MSYFGTTLTKTTDSTSTLLSRWRTIQPTKVQLTPTVSVERTSAGPLVEVDAAEPSVPAPPAKEGLGIGWKTVAGLGAVAAGLLFVATRRGKR